METKYYMYQRILNATYMEHIIYKEDGKVTRETLDMLSYSKDDDLTVFLKYIFAKNYDEQEAALKDNEKISKFVDFLQTHYNLKIGLDNLPSGDYIETFYVHVAKVSDVKILIDFDFDTYKDRINKKIVFREVGV